MKMLPNKVLPYTVFAFLSGATFTIIPMTASADPIELNINITCPGVDSIRNFGNAIAGYGNEEMDNHGAKPIYFKSTAIAPNTPSQFNHYFNSGTEYNSTTGIVTCNYTSQEGEREPSVAVSYTLTNGKGGAILSQSTYSIFISLPVGYLKK